MLSITPRQAVGTLGVLMFIAGFIALMIPVSDSYDSGYFGNQTVNCGTPLKTKVEFLGGDPLQVCEDALSTRRAWSWPLLAVGVVVVVGAVLVQSPSPRQPAAE